MARPREPIDLIATKGRKHLTKAEYEERKSTEVKAPCGNVAPPAWLAKKEKEKFDSIAKQLADIGIMSDLDCDALARYIRADTEYIKVTRQLSKVRFTAGRKSQGSREEQFAEQAAKYNFLQKMQVRAADQCRVCARELGLTVSSRCRLVMPKKEESPPENKFMKHA